MALNNEFKVKNDLNTLGRILSGGVDIRTIFSPSNTSWTLSANNGTFALSGGDTLQVQGGNGVDVRVATGTDTVRISGIDATTSVKGVASFNSASFAVTNGDVTIKSSGVSNAQLSGSITDNKLSTISTAGKVLNSATTATSANTANAIVARGASGEFSSGNITSSGTVEAVTVNATTGFKLNNGATSGNFLRGNGTNFVSSAIQASDVTTLNQSTTGSAATLTTARTLWGQSFNGSANVSGTLSAVGDIIGSSAITLSAGSGNNNINLTPSGTGLVTATGNLSASGTVTGNAVVASNITATNLLSAANTFTRLLSVGEVQVRTVGTSNVFLGDSTTGRDAATGVHNFVFGLNAGSALTVGGYNNFLGSGAGKFNDSGDNNNFFGRFAGCSNTTGCSNNFLGRFAGSGNTTGGFNNFLGSSAGAYNTTGCGNNFLGYAAGNANTTGSCNNFIGYFAGNKNTTGCNNNFFGKVAGYSNTTGSNNNFLGFSAGLCNTTGTDNNFLSRYAGATNTTGCSNNFLGFSAGRANTTGGSNNFLGANAGCTNTTGGNNNFFGACAGYSNTTGNLNNFLGSYAGRTSTIGSNNTIIGNRADVATDALSGVIVLGTGAVATESNQIVLSTANVSFRNIGSTFEIGTPSLTDNLTVFGAVSSTDIVNTNTGFRVNNGATTGNFLRGNGTNFVSSAILASDVTTLNQSTTGSAATLTTARTIAISGDLTYTSPPFNGSTNVAAAGTLATVNSNVGSFTNASVTVNAKGLVTAASSGTAPVTTVTGTSPVVSSGGTTPAISLASGYGDTQNPYASKTQNTFLAAPSAASGVPTFRTIVTTDVPTLNQNTTGSAATLTTTRTLWGQNFNGSANVTGNLTNVGDISGTAGITIYTGSSNQDITLSTSGTGEVNIAKVDIDGGRIDGTPIGLTTPASGVFTGVTVTGDVSIDGSLYISGSATRIDTTNLIVSDPIIFLGEGNLADAVDIGFTAAYNHGLTPPRHTGLIRDDTTKKWTLFSNLSTEILSAVQIPLDNPSVQIDTLRANIEGTLTGNVSGTALRANQFTTARIISASGDISYSSGSFDGSANVTGTATINNNTVTYAKFQQVAANSVVGNPTGSLANAQAIPASVTGFALLSATNAAAAATTIGLGTTNSVTFGEVIVNNGTKSVVNDVYNNSGTNAITLSTFANASYNSAKFTVQIKRVDTSARCALEIIATKSLSTWEGTVYGIVDPANLFTDVNITAGSTVELAFTLVGATNHTITAYAQAISD